MRLLSLKQRKERDGLDGLSKTHCSYQARFDECFVRSPHEYVEFTWCATRTLISKNATESFAMQEVQPIHADHLVVLELLVQRGRLLANDHHGFGIGYRGIGGTLSKRVRRYGGSGDAAVVH